MDELLCARVNGSKHQLELCKDAFSLSHPSTLSRRIMFDVLEEHGGKISIGG